MSYDGHWGNVTLTKDSNVISSFKTPLKVTHAQDCNTDAPTLTLQMDTVAEGRLTTGGVDIGAAITALTADIGEAITALTAQSYAGWYMSGVDADGNCNKAR